MQKHIITIIMCILLNVSLFAFDASNDATNNINTPPVIEFPIDIQVNLVSTGIAWYNDGSVGILPTLGLSVRLSRSLFGFEIDPGVYFSWLSIGTIIGVGGTIINGTGGPSFLFTTGLSLGFVENILVISPSYVLTVNGSYTQHAFAIMVSSTLLEF